MVTTDMRSLPLPQAIEEGTIDNLDNSDFVDTDIPFEVPLPEKQFVSVRDDYRCYVLVYIRSFPTSSGRKTRRSEGMGTSCLYGPEGCANRVPMPILFFLTSGCLYLMQVEQSLPADERGTYVASLTSPHTKVTSPPCMISGKYLCGVEGGKGRRREESTSPPPPFHRLSCS